MFLRVWRIDLSTNLFWTAGYTKWGVSETSLGRSMSTLIRNTSIVVVTYSMKIDTL